MVAQNRKARHNFFIEDSLEAGLILTGTAASGTVSVGESLVLQPRRIIVRVRGIHTQDAPAATGNAGERCALNVSGDVHKDDIERGDWLASEHCIDTTSRFDARIHLLPDAAFPLKHLSEVTLLHISQLPLDDPLKLTIFTLRIFLKI